MTQAAVAGDEGNFGEGDRRTVMVGVKLDAQSRELLTWALVKVAQPGDRVIAVHVLDSNDSPSHSPTRRTYSASGPLTLILGKWIRNLYLQCPKKHTYVCPVFEATGSCPLGPECKHHHPKKKKKGMTGKASNIQKNARGRYFGSGHADVADVGAVCDIIAGGSDGNGLGERGFGDYISLDIRMDEREQAFELRSEPTCDSEGPSDVQRAEDDELAKPIRVMNKNVIIDSSLAADSSSEMATSYVSEESFL